MNPLATPIPRTLIADDQPDVLAALRLLLKGAGYQTEAVSSPAAVLDALQHHKFDLVLMDLNYARDTTSGKEGLDLISRIHALDSLLPIVVMTAWGSVDLAVETMRRGVRDFVQKPWDNSRLLHTLRTQIEQGRLRRNLQRRNAENRMRNRKLRVELQEAREIQEGLMPKAMPCVDGLHLASAWHPALTVSGDFLTAFNPDEEHLALCVADVSGKGLPAALLMANMQAALKSNAQSNISPATLCDRLNQVMYGNTPENKFITCFYGLMDIQRRRLTYSNAGHNPPFLVRRNGDCLRLEAGGPVLGPFIDSIYSEGEVELRSDDRLVLFTDGLTEVTNSAGDEFGEDRLRDLIVANRNLSASDLQAKIMDTVREFCNNEFHDDAALLVMEAISEVTL